MAQIPMSKMSRPMRRAHQRAMIRKTMTKAERRQYVRMPAVLKHEVYHSTLAMIAMNKMNYATTATTPETQTVTTTAVTTDLPTQDE